MVDPGDYISVNAFTAIYEIINDNAISGDGDEWVLEELIAYIKITLSAESVIETPLQFTNTPVPIDLPTQTLLPSETNSPTP